MSWRMSGTGAEVPAEVAAAESRFSRGLWLRTGTASMTTSIPEISEFWRMCDPNGLITHFDAFRRANDLKKTVRWQLDVAEKKTETNGMIRLLANWLLSAVALLLVSRVVSGFHVDTLGTALIAALVFGLLNMTLGLVLKLVTLPLTILTLGIFLLVINAFVLELASGFVRGFHIRSFSAAFWGAAVLALVQMLFRFLVNEAE